MFGARANEKMAFLFTEMEGYQGTGMEESRHSVLHLLSLRCSLDTQIEMRNVVACMSLECRGEGNVILIHMVFKVMRPSESRTSLAHEAK